MRLTNVGRHCGLYTRHLVKRLRTRSRWGALHSFDGVEAPEIPGRGEIPRLELIASSHPEVLRHVVYERGTFRVLQPPETEKGMEESEAKEVLRTSPEEI